RAFAGAVGHFNIVITDYGRSGDAVGRARQDLYAAYVAWLQAADASLPYADAITVFTSRQTDTSCDANCQTAAHTLEVQARYQYGTRLAAAGDYQNAITQFEMIQTKFPKSSYAAQAHTAAAQAYLAHGKAQLAGACSQALPDYQTLAKRYADTPEGKQA